MANKNKLIRMDSLLLRLRKLSRARTHLSLDRGACYGGQLSGFRVLGFVGALGDFFP
jgi:hypothetical protein